MGCLTQLLVFVFGLWFGFNTIAGTSVEIAAPPGAVSLTLTLPPPNEEMPFEVQNNVITFNEREPFGTPPCNNAIKGQVLDLNGQPFTDFDIFIEMVDLEDVVEPERGKAYTFEDGTWNSVLLWQVRYNVWMTLKGSEERISPIITVPTGDCDVATINFVQVRPLQQDK